MYTLSKSCLTDHSTCQSKVNLLADLILSALQDKYARVSTTHCECICSNPKPTLLIYLLNPYLIHSEGTGYFSATMQVPDTKLPLWYGN